MKRPYGDWKEIREGLFYDERHDLYYDDKTKQVYDELSARHNGIIGHGYQLRSIIKNEEVNRKL